VRSPTTIDRDGNAGPSWQGVSAGQKVYRTRTGLASSIADYRNACIDIAWLYVVVAVLAIFSRFPCLAADNFTFPGRELTDYNGSVAIRAISHFLSESELMSAFLVPVKPGLVVIPLEKAIVLIGRQSDCDVSLTQSRKVSRKHCCLAQVNNQILARDLGSTNGVFLNGERIKRQCRLKLGDELMIGDLKFRLQDDPNPPAAEAKPAKEKPIAKPLVEDALETLSSKPTPFVRGMPGGELPSMDIPVILAEDGRDFAVESSLMKPPVKSPARDESSPLVAYQPPPERPNSDDEVIPLKSDSGI
jgi:hypothetical protein